MKAKDTTISGNLVIPATIQYGEDNYSVTSIESRGFQNCTKITGVKIPNTITSIPSYAFDSCILLDTITLPDSLESINGHSFKNTAIKSIVIPKTVKTLNALGLAYCKNLQTIKIQEGNTKFTSKGVYNNDTIECNAVINISTKQLVSGCKNTIIPSDVKSIGANAFRGSGLKSIILPQTLTGPNDIGKNIINGGAFRDCKELETVTILFQWVGGIGSQILNQVFVGCPALKTIFCSSLKPVSLGSDSNPSFSSDITDVTLYVPAGSKNSYSGTSGWGYIVSNNNWTVKEVAQLYTNRWNFVAGLGNQASLYNNNNPNVQNQHCDIAITGYDYTNNAWSSSYLYANDSMTAGAGYFVWAFNENAQGTLITTDATMTTLDMSSSYLTSGNVTLSATNNGNATGSGSVSAKWFAFGNPFDKQLTKTEILNALGSNVQSDVLYTYDAYQGMWNDSAIVVYPGQGFMVASVDGQTAVSGTINYPTTNSAPAQPENYGIRFSVNANGINSDIFAKQVSEANDGFDTKDAYALFGNNENLVEPYFVVEGRQIIHNRYNSDNYACEINFHAQKSGVAELSVSDVPEGTIVSIVDLAMNEETVLEDNVFEFDVQVGENSGRYQIKIVKNNSSINTTAQNEANISIWNNNKEVFVKGEKLQRVEVYNTLGQKVYQREISGDAYNFTFDNEGAYIVKVTSENGTKSQKVQVLPAL